MEVEPAAAGPAASGWTCAACGYRNEGVALCDRCGVSRRWSEDPPLDVPPPPSAFERPAAWMASLHGALAAFGALLWVQPGIAPWLALAGPAQAVQVLLSLGACLAALNQAVTECLFHEVRLEMPDRVPTGEPLVAAARVVPYRHTSGASVTLALVENTYERSRGSSRNQTITTRSRTLASHDMLRGGTLRGRNANAFEATFQAPVPTGNHLSVAAELQASLMRAFAWLVPGLGHAARNLAEHGGVWVRLTVRVGPWRRRVERRVFVYHIGASRLHVA